MEQLRELIKKETSVEKRKQKDDKVGAIGVTFLRQASMKKQKGDSLALPSMMVSTISQKLNLKKKFSSFIPTKIAEVEGFTEIDEDELAIIYYVTNLILMEHFNIADSRIEKQIYKIRDVSATFKGNIARLRALCKFEHMKQHAHKTDKRDMNSDHQKRSLESIFGHLTEAEK